MNHKTQEKTEAISGQKIPNISGAPEYKQEAECPETGNSTSYGWLTDVRNCVDRIPQSEFSLDEIYAFVDELQDKHPDNHHVEAKIRQQLQLLRNEGVLEFLGDGKYKKLS